MTHPTDDELEAMAVTMADYCLHDVAAMLRAVKGRAKPLPRGDGEGGWTLPMELLADLEREVIADGWDGCTAEVTEIIALSVERRILAALEPAPDHSEWDAAIEAAAKVALDQEQACSDWFMQTGQHCNVYEQLPIVAEHIRALKKGQTNEKAKESHHG